MILSGMKMGFSFQEVKHMSLTRLGNYIDAYNELNAPEEEGTTRIATQADIDALV